MDLAPYRKRVFKTLSIQPAKDGLRQMVRKKGTLNVGHAIIGFATESGELLQGLHQYISGASQLKSEMKTNAREELGDMAYYATVMAKELKVKLPGAKRKVKLDGTLTDNILLLNSLATDLLDAYKKVYYGQDVDVERVKERLTLAGNYLWGVTYMLTGEPPDKVLDENIAKLAARYPDGFFDNKAQAERDVAKEQAAVQKEATAPKPAAKKKAVPANFLKKKAATKSTAAPAGA